MAKHVICSVDELPPGQRKIVDVAGKSIGVFNLDGRFHAIRNVCPHQLAPLCQGALTGTAEADGRDDVRWVKDGQIIRCPWHGWEFDITTGQSVFNPHRCRVKSYEVTLEAGSDAAGATRTIPCDEQDPSVETFEVSVERRRVVLHV